MRIDSPESVEAEKPLGNGGDHINVISEDVNRRENPTCSRNHGPVVVVRFWLRDSTTPFCRRDRLSCDSRNGMAANAQQPQSPGRRPGSPPAGREICPRPTVAALAFGETATTPCCMMVLTRAGEAAPAAPNIG